jgi:hypothetical protein
MTRPDDLRTTAQFLSITRVAAALGVERRVVRELISRGSLVPVDAGISNDGNRYVRYVTTESVRRYVERARRDGEWSLSLCSRCKGERFTREGSSLCGPCADRLADKEVERLEHRRARKRDWWRANGPEWRARRRAADKEGNP